MDGAEWHTESLVTFEGPSIQTPFVRDDFAWPIVSPSDSPSSISEPPCPVYSSLNLDATHRYPLNTGPNAGPLEIEAMRQAWQSGKPLAVFMAAKCPLLPCAVPLGVNYFLLDHYVVSNEPHWDV